MHSNYIKAAEHLLAFKGVVFSHVTDNQPPIQSLDQIQSRLASNKEYPIYQRS